MPVWLGPDPGLAAIMMGRWKSQARSQAALLGGASLWNGEIMETRCAVDAWDTLQSVWELLSVRGRAHYRRWQLAGPRSSATARRHIGNAKATNPHMQHYILVYFVYKCNVCTNLFGLLIAKCRLTRQYFASPQHPFTNTSLWPFRVTLPKRKSAAETLLNTTDEEASCKKEKKKNLLIGADRLAKQCCNYNLISGQQAESSIPFNINNLTLNKNPLRIDFKASNRCFGGETVVLHFCLPLEVTQCQLKKERKMMKRNSAEDKSLLQSFPRRACWMVNIKHWLHTNRHGSLIITGYCLPEIIA